MALFVITTKPWEETIEASSPTEAMAKFAATMLSDMNIYFEAISADEYEIHKMNKFAEGHKAFVISFMESVLVHDFEMSEKDAEDLALRAFDLYAEGDGLTEYEACEAAYEEYKERSDTNA